MSYYITALHVFNLNVNLLSELEFLSLSRSTFLLFGVASLKIIPNKQRVVVRKMLIYVNYADI